VTGQTPGAQHGVQVATTDRAGLLYLLDQDPARVVTLDPKTGAQATYATFPRVRGAPEPDFAAWGPDGSLYVTDYAQFLIYRVPPGGGTAQVWLDDTRLNGIIVGPAGIELMPDGHTLMFDTGGGGTPDIVTGKLYALPIQADGSPGAVRQLWESNLAEAPDGFAIAQSGNVYISLVGPTGNAVVELSPQYKEIARVPGNPIANSQLPVPFDAPGSVAFDGDRLIVANESSIFGDDTHMALLTINAGESGLPVSLPPAPAAAPSYRLRVAPGRVTAGHRTTFRFVAPAGTIRFAGRRLRVRSGRAHVRLTLHRRRHRYRAVLVVGGRRVAGAVVRTR
jgi:sugar lactone lactonase YvrE